MESIPKLVIVESPTKARTISRFLGSGFTVASSFGHVRDLPISQLGIDVEHDFAPHYIIPVKARPNVKKLKGEASRAEKIILATDQDREGEAIAWHLAQALGLNEGKRGKGKRKSIERIAFHEITERAIEDALTHPREIDMNLVDAQQARRILDRLVGYKLSPFLWKKMYRGLSAGRVQSVAVRLVVEREREIQNFKAQEYWSIVALLLKEKNMPRTRPALGTEMAVEDLSIKGETDDMKDAFEASLVKINGEALDKFAIKNKEEAERLLKNLEGATWTVSEVERKAVSKNPLPPFTTSTLQQEAFRRFGFSAKQTMFLAQQLYEGVELGAHGPIGLITYMRTDSVNISHDALKSAREYLDRTLGITYVTPAPRQFQTRAKGAQEAHEAIRPTDPWRTPDDTKPFLENRHQKLYELIWRRFIATQMPSAIVDRTTVSVDTRNHSTPVFYRFQATGQTLRFDGFLKIYPLKIGEMELPPLTPQDPLECQAITPHQHFTEPPPRFTEATLIKILEQHGIGRPSTYAPTLSTIQNRGYIQRHERRYLQPTETGFLVNDLLVAHFPQIVDIEFTAKMEEELDEIASGEKQWTPVIRAFYEPFAKLLEEKYQEVKRQEPVETSDQRCPACGKPMVVKLGRFGKFLACSGFPECKTTQSLNGKEKQKPQEIGMRCPKCQEGNVVVRKTARRGKIFYGCSRYPACDFASWTNPLEEKK